MCYVVPTFFSRFRWSWLTHLEYVFSKTGHVDQVSRYSLSLQGDSASDYEMPLVRRPSSDSYGEFVAFQGYPPVSETEKNHVTFGSDYLLSTGSFYTLLIEVGFTVCAVAGDLMLTRGTAIEQGRLECPH
jgi:hypothetical protein